MRARFGWVGVAVVLSAGVGAAAALVESPVPSSGAAIDRPVSTVVARDLVTPQVRSLASEAQQLGQEITNARGELTYLEHEVAYEATLSHYRLSAPTPTLRAAPSTGVRSRDEAAGASTTTRSEGEGTSSSPSTTDSTTTAPTTTPAPTPCATSYEDAPPSSGAGCPTGVSYDN